MDIPNETNETIVPDGNQQPNPEQAPVQVNNLSDAGKAFLESLTVDTGGETPPAIEEPAQGQEEIINIPAEDGLVENSSEPPAVETAPAPPAQPAAPENSLTLEAVKDAILSEIKNLGTSTETQNPEGKEGEESPEAPEIDLNDDAFMEKFSENPAQAVYELANSIADKKVAAQMSDLMDKMKPVLDQSEQITFQNAVKDTITNFMGNEEYPDAEKYFPQMAEYIKAHDLPQDNVGSYETAYLKAALQDAKNTMANQSQNQGKTLEDYLADENAVSQITANPQIQKAIIEGYLKQIAEGAKPQVINGGGSVSPVAAPATKFTSFEDAGKAFKQQLG